MAEGLKVRFHGSPVKILSIIALSIFVAEFMVMLILYFTPHESVITHALIDSGILIVLLSPILFFFLFRPLISHVNERKRVELDLIKERDRAQRYLDVAGVMLLVLDHKGKVKLINKRGCEILGCEESEIVGKDWFENFIPERVRNEVREVFLRILSRGGETGENYENPIVRRSGDERVIYWHNRILRENGKIVGTLSSGEDVTERKEAEGALRESETRYRLIHDSAFDAIIIADAVDKVIECNPSAEKMFGYDNGEMIGVNIEMLMPRHFRERHKEGLERFLETRESKIQGRVLELEGLRKSGEVFPIELILSSFTMGEDIYFSGTIRDITERKLAEEEKIQMQAQLNQVQKMEAIGTLAGGVAHDFNNMLTAIRGNAELAMEDVGPETPVYSRLNEIVLSVSHASKLTRQLLLFSRKQPIRLFPLDINRAVESILPIITRLLGEEIEVASELAEDIWTVKADESNIEQVLLNLAVNARDAMPKGGRITVKTENRTFSEAEVRGVPGAQPGKTVCFSVSDTGPGISEEVRHRIFEPFFSTKEPGEGTGLGLAVVYGIVKQHRGWITVDSRPGEGSTFRVCIPALPEGLAREIGKEEKPTGMGEKILLVEDEPGVRKVTRKALVENGYIVFEASNAGEAREIFEREGGKFDVVLSCVELGDMSGVELADIFAFKEPGLPVILTASHMDDRHGRSEIKDKGYELLAKPYSLLDLQRTVADTVARARNKSGHQGSRK